MTLSPARRISLIFLMALSSQSVRCAETTPSATPQPQVLIIGDSISLGYTPFVTKLLQAETAVRHHPGNAQHTGTGLKNIDAWLGTTKWDVIHFNWGLWDLCYRNPAVKNQGNRDKLKGTLTTSLAQYETNLEQLVQRLEKTGAILIWAHTTIVPAGEEGRFVGDDRKYNEVAARVMKRHRIAINDLHTLSAKLPADLFVEPGNVHFKPEGYEKLAAQVADSIRLTLKGRPLPKR